MLGGDSRAFREIANVENFKSMASAAISDFANNVKANFPNVTKISYAWAESVNSKNGGDPSVYPHYFSDSFNIHNLYKYICPKFGIQYLGWLGFNILLSDQYFSNDGYHPNDAGYKMLAAYFKSSYASGVIDYHNLFFNKTQIPSEIIAGATNKFNLTVFPDRCLINIFGEYLPAGNTPAHATIVKLFNFLNEKFQLPLPGILQMLEIGAFKQIGCIGGSRAYDPTKDIIRKNGSLCR